MFTTTLQMPIYRIVSFVKEGKYTLNLPAKPKRNFAFIEALYMHLPIKLIAYQHDSGWLEFSEDASLKIQTLIDVMNNKCPLEGFQYNPSLNGVKYKDLAYSDTHQIHLNDLLILITKDKDSLDNFASRFQGI